MVTILSQSGPYVVPTCSACSLHDLYLFLFCLVNTWSLSGNNLVQYLYPTWTLPSLPGTNMVSIVPIGYPCCPNWFPMLSPHVLRIPYMVWSTVWSLHGHYLVITWSLPGLFLGPTWILPADWYQYGPYVVSMLFLHVLRAPYMVPTWFWADWLLTGPYLVTTWSLLGLYMVPILSLSGPYLVPIWSLCGPGMVCTVTTWSLRGSYMANLVPTWSLTGPGPYLVHT